jgi:hypothetical protein
MIAVKIGDGEGQAGSRGSDERRWKANGGLGSRGYGSGSGKREKRKDG